MIPAFVLENISIVTVQNFKLQLTYFNELNVST
jgi:hypothetical protein